MALQNARTFLFRGEDLGAGGALPEELVSPTVAPAAARPIILSLGFYGSTNQLNTLLGTAGNPAAGLAGLNRFVVNRSSRYWVSLTVTLAASNAVLSPQVVTIPIAPLQTMFLPCTAYAVAGSIIAADSLWPLILAPNQVGGTLPPVAGTTAMLNFDFVQEQ